MMEEMIFFGNEICCGTYAFLNTIQEDTIDYKLFEITTTVPFGIKHQREMDFSRLLTTFCDPNEGVDKAAALWGYRQEKKIFEDEREAAAYIGEESYRHRCMVGPLDMGKLEYLLIPNLYTNMDHYITVFREGGELFCVDSEGIPARRISLEELKTWMCVKKLPEAKGHIAVRTFEREEGFVREKRDEQVLLRSISAIAGNIRKAEEAKQGSRAVKACWDWLGEQPMNRWRLSFLYDISFLIQRKFLQNYWKKLLWKFDILKKGTIYEIGDIVERQIDLLSDMFRFLRSDNRVYQENFIRLAELEREFYNTMEKVGKTDVSGA